MLSERAQRSQTPGVIPEANVSSRPSHDYYTHGQSSRSSKLSQPNTFTPATSTRVRHSINHQRQCAFPSISYSQERNASEHLLRRKTPNGTLAAGYDGSSNEQTQTPHPPKHLLMPISKSSQTTHPTFQFAAPFANQPSPQPFSSFAARAGSQHNYDYRPYHSSLDNNPIEVETDGTLKPGGRPSVGMDSVLSQSSMQSFLFNTATSHSVPTVLQPLWPPCLGPTSLHTPGPVGPYWPNGAFEPYRPAPIRDSRYQTAPQAHSSDSHAHLHQLAPIRHGAFLDSRPSRPAKNPHSLPYTPKTPRTHTKYHSSKDGQSPGSLPYDFQLKLAIDQDHPGGPAISIDDPIKVQDSDHPIRCVVLPREAYIASEHAQFKERILHWAHRTYCSLLASIEASRKEQLPGVHNTSANPSYSQRPRRPYPSWSSKQLQSTSASSCCGASDASVSIATNSLSVTSDIVPGDNAHGNWNCAHTPNSAPMHDPSPYLWFGQDGTPSGVPVQHFRPQHSTVCPSYVPLHLSQAHIASSPLSAAMNAMEILSRLCEESHWQWLDGMLLNGCLAYGLGNYLKATKWYLKVLRKDPENVEAMSNLAATYLSLGRRSEAEQYWMRSVKQRPSYFEAVEHLVGLLHEEHRGKEAVRVIEYVETALSDRYVSGTYGSPQFLQNAQSGSSGYAIRPSENGRLLTLIHGKGNVLYQSGDNDGAAKAFEEAILIGTGQYKTGIQGLINHILTVFSERRQLLSASPDEKISHEQPVLLPPESALESARLVFPPNGSLPGLKDVPMGMAQKAAISIISNSLLSLAKIYQDGMSSSGASAAAPRATSGVQEILALYYLSLSLQPSPSTANNVGILLAGVQQPSRLSHQPVSPKVSQSTPTSGVVPGSGVALALAYYDYGLKLDARHAHLYTNLGSLFKDIGQLSAAIRMYEKAVDCDGDFDIALANLANAVKDKGNIRDAVHYYKRAVASNPDFAEAVCGLANALNSVCSWNGRGGLCYPKGDLDRWHVDEQGLLFDSKTASATSSGWMERVVTIVQKQLGDGRNWGKGVILNVGISHLIRQLGQSVNVSNLDQIQRALCMWTENCWEGAKVVRLVERATKNLTWSLYREKYICGVSSNAVSRVRPQLPAVLAVPSAPTVLPFHTFTCPLSAKQIRLISQRNGLRVSCTTLRAPWLPAHVYEPPPTPSPHLNVGYVSSDFNNHPLAHLMQSVFGLHDPSKVRAVCYATTTSDGSIHRKQIEQESPTFYDCSSWSTEHLVNQIVEDKIHILVNLNGYTRGAKNEVFAARPAPVQMSFMGFAGTLGAEWCDYLLADEIAIPPGTLRPYRKNVNFLDQLVDGNNDDSTEGWVYGENIVFTRDTFFCCDHRQSAPDAHEEQLSWSDEQKRRWKMRKELFPELADDVVILGNFNQLYKIEPTTFRSWLRILSRVPKSVLWLLRFPELGEQHLRQTALQWVGAEVASRLIFTDVAPKQHHIARARVCDLFVDTPECNAHTTAADVLWSGTPLLTYPKYEYKMCARMAASIIRGALPKNTAGKRAAEDLIASSDETYEEQGVELASDLVYPIKSGEEGFGKGRLVELRRLLYESRWTSALFDTRRWVHDLETAYGEAWRRWVQGEGGDIWI